MPARRPSREAGAATLETVGMTIVAAVVAVAVILVAADGRVFGGALSAAICRVVTLGMGSCDGPTSAADHEPTDPCVVSSSATERNTKVAVLVVTAEDGKRILIETLNDGRRRITVTDSEGVGLETGVGAGISLTVNDRTVGGSATAQVGASLNIRTGDVYYADDDTAYEDIMRGVLQDEVKDQVVGDSGPVRWLTDRGEELFGVDNDLPEPSEVYAEGGVSLNASAEATGLTDHAKAGISAAEVLGVRTTREGSTTIYVKTKVSGEAGLQTLGIDTSGVQFEGAKVEGSMEVVNAVTFDSNGNLVSVEATAVAAGTSSGIVNAAFGGSGDPALGNQQSGAVVYRATLPVRTDGDRLVAGNYLLAQGIGSLGGWSNPALTVTSLTSTAGFIDAARDRGYLTAQTYETNNNTAFGVDATGKLGLELGVSASVKTEEMDAVEAQYWDGTRFVDWEGCAA